MPEVTPISPSLATAAQRRFWRGLDELEGAAPREVPQDVVTFEPPRLARRAFLRVMAASAALAAGGCSRAPLETIVPYRNGPAQDGYGKPVFYASALERDGYAIGVLVETNMGRPTKIEGNPLHPASLGATDIFTQAAVLELWDPDRSTASLRNGAVDTWPRFVTELRERVIAAPDGDGIALLTETVTSPTLHDQIRTFLEGHPRARWHQYQPVNRDNVYDGSRLALGEAVEPVYRFGDAAVIVALDADIVGALPGAVRHARDIAVARRGATRPTIHAAEGSPSLTGALADRRLVIRTGEIAMLADALAAQIGGGESSAAQVGGAAGGAAQGGGVASGAAQVGGAASGVATAALGADARAWLDRVAADLAAHRGRAIVVAGDRQPAGVHARVHAINRALGNDALVATREPVAFDAGNQGDSLRALASDMRAGRVTTLVMLGGNPVYASPRDLDFGGALRKLPWSAHLALHADETSAASTWHVAAAHALESWGDARAFDGTVAIRQPAIAPLYDGHSAHEVVSVLVDGNPRPGHAIVRDFWQRRHPGHGARCGAHDVARRRARARVRGLLARGAARRRVREWRLRTGRREREAHRLSPAARRRAGLERAAACRSLDSRRGVGEQRVAAGAAEAAEQAHLGQRGVDERGIGGEARRGAGRPRRGRCRLAQRSRAGVDPSRSCRRRGDALARVRAHARGPGRQRCGRRCLCAAHAGRAVDARRRRGAQGEGPP
jgi:molybdopterin-containing oxidoreductase family iron-sulfur binding subunit